MSAPDVSRLLAVLSEKLDGRFRFVGGPFDDAVLLVGGETRDQPSSELLIEVERVSLDAPAPILEARAVAYPAVRERRLSGERPRLLSTLIIPSVAGGLVFDRRSDRPGVVTHYPGACHLLGGGVNPPSAGLGGAAWLRHEARRETEEETRTTLPPAAISREFWLTEEPTTGYLQCCFGAVAARPPEPSADPRREGDPFVQPLASLETWLATSWSRWVPSGLANVLLDMVLRRGIPEDRVVALARAIDPRGLAEP